MGEVYRARDTSLGREVAIKILPPSFAADPERLARFEREARLLASLNHPHIAQIYGLEGRESEPRVPVIVMELVDGDTLADRLRRGPLKLDDALAIARQIADALDAAHEKGIVHRDLKPSNIALTRDGAVKILDFGLAKEVSDGLGAADLTDSPTMLSPTMAGVVLGTAPYMSPEQARGKAVDKRTDIWAFGCVLFEMLTGGPAFGGETTTDTIAAILERDPDWSALPSSVPPFVRDLLRRSLTKDLRQRLRDIGDARLDGASLVPAARPRAAAPTRWVVLTAAAAAIAAAAWFARTTRNPSLPSWAREPVSLSIDSTAPSSGPAIFPSSTLAVSRDGRHVAWVAVKPDGPPIISIYSVPTGETRALSGTEGAMNPFWAPDSHALGFQSQGSLRTIDLTTGSVKAIAANADVSAGGTWNTENTIVFSTRYTLDQVPASGGDTRTVATLNSDFQENSLRYPRFLPDGRHFLYVARSGRALKSGAYIGSIDGGKPVRLFATTSHVEYAPPGYLVSVKDGELVARTFDASTLTAGAETFSIVSHIEASAGSMNGQFALSDNGVLTYLRRSTVLKAILRWYDRSGRPLEAIGGPEAYSAFRLAPDGQRVAVDLASERLVVRDVWVINPGGARTRVTFGGSDDWLPFWSPDGKKVAFMSYRNGVGDLFLKALDGAAPEQSLLRPGDGPGPSDQKVPGDWSSDGKLIAYWSERPETRGDVWVQTIDGSQKAVALARTRSNERRPRFSPDSRFVAYESDETGTYEIYVQPFPPTGGKWQISVGGGSEVAWRGDGGEMYFIDGTGMLVAVPVRTSVAGFAVRSPVRLFSLGRRPTPGGSIRFDVRRDGQRFLVRDVVDPPPQPIVVLMNWPVRLTRH